MYRVLFLGEFPRQDHIGGSPVSNLEVLKALRQEGHEVVALAPIFKGEKKLAEEMPVVFLPTRYLRIKMFGDIVCKLDFARQVGRFLDKSGFEPDVIFIDACPYFCRLFPKKPKVLSIHGSSKYRYHPPITNLFRGPYSHLCGMFESREEEAALWNSDVKKIINNSERSNAALIADYNLPGTIVQKTVVVPRGFDSARFSVRDVPKEDCRSMMLDHINAPKDTKTTLVFVGALSPHKGQFDLINSMPEILKRAPETALVLIGKNAGDGERCRTFITEHALTKNVFLVPTLSDRDLGIFLKGADIYSSAATEGFGINQIEGMGMGLPLVAYDRGAIRELFQSGTHGFLVQNANEFTEAVLRLIKNQEERETMGFAAKEHVLQKYTWKKMTEAVNKALLQAIIGGA